MRAEIRRLHNRLGVTSVYVTHDQVEAMTLADRIVIMNEGRIEQIGTPMDLFMNPANTFVAGFIGSPPMNLLDAEVVSDGGALKARLGDGANFPLPEASGLANAQGRPITVGIRPEDVGIERQNGSDGTPCILDLVEPLGSEALLHTSVAGHPFIVKAETRGDVTHLNAVDRLYFDPGPCAYLRSGNRRHHRRPIDSATEASPMAKSEAPLQETRRSTTRSLAAFRASRIIAALVRSPSQKGVADLRPPGADDHLVPRLPL